MAEEKKTVRVRVERSFYDGGKALTVGQVANVDPVLAREMVAARKATIVGDAATAKELADEAAQAATRAAMAAAGPPKLYPNWR